MFRDVFTLCIRRYTAPSPESFTEKSPPARLAYVLPPFFSTVGIQWLYHNMIYPNMISAIILILVYFFLFFYGLCLCLFFDPMYFNTPDFRLGKKSAVRRIKGILFIQHGHLKLASTSSLKTELRCCTNIIFITIGTVPILPHLIHI